MMEFIYNHHPELFFSTETEKRDSEQSFSICSHLKVVNSGPSPPIKEEF